ncbi:MAG TPA: metallophosphoesterase [Micrococcales bacterium]|nr:metallophosphoesterase [Micrococcales bacterium]
MAAFLYRSAGSPRFTPPSMSPFVDVPVGSRFYKEISWLYAFEISTGSPGSLGTEYRPLTSVNRDAMAAFLFRFDGVDASPWPVMPGAEDGDGVFTIAVYPDTQQEVWGSAFLSRTNWLVTNRSALDLRFVDHTGDVVNWDTDDHAQYEVASNALSPLEGAGIPYSLSIGNHDTMATGVGGSARDPKFTRAFQRDTTTFNTYFTASRFGAVAGAYEAGKVDNVFSTFTAEGHNWLVLSLELWPRLDVVTWANAVVAEHPHHNVIISTHSYLDADGSIWTGCEPTRCGYGDASPQYLYDNLISQHPNIKVVLSGHTGAALTRTAVTPTGNAVLYYLTAIHSNSTNPVRLLTIDTTTNSIRTDVFGINDGFDFGDTNVHSGLNFVD